MAGEVFKTMPILLNIRYAITDTYYTIIINYSFKKSTTELFCNYLIDGSLV